LLYFSATTAATGRELFQTDGTTAGTVLVTDARPGPEGSSPRLLGFAGGKLVVSAELRDEEVALYVLEQGKLSLLEGPGPDASPDSFYQALPFGDRLMVIDDERGGILITDGIPGGGTWIPESVVGPSPQLLGELAPSRALLTGDNGLVGQELMLSDGTTAGTGLLKEVEKASDLLGSELAALGCPNGDDLFTIVTGAPGKDLLGIHERNGIQNLFGGKDSLSAAELPTQVWLGDHAELLFATSHFAKWSIRVSLTATDGTPRGTSTLATPLDAIGPMRTLGGDGRSALLYGLHATLGPELWISDGTTQGTHVIGDLVPPPPLAPTSLRAVRMGGLFYLSLPDSATTQALWKTDGSLAGSSKLAGGLTGEAFADLRLLAIGDRVFFVADDGVHGTEPWVTDGTTAGTHMVKDIQSGPLGSAITKLVAFQGQAHFMAKDHANLGPRLWRSDGTEAGTIKVATVKSIVGGSIAATNSYVYFQAQLSTGATLWAYDGLAASPLLSPTPGAKVESPDDLTPCGDHLYCTAWSDATGREIYVADASAGTLSVAFDLMPGPGGSDPGLLTLCSGNLFFEGTGADGDHELYVYDTGLAHTIPLGQGWADIHLTATPPVIGSPVTMTVEDPPAGGVSMLVMSGPIAPLGDFVAPGNTLWVDPSNFTVLGYGITPGWSATHTIPNHSSLIGSEFNVQAWFMPPSPALGVTSNGLRLFVGL
jgi:ELWxxDGT repeat protein